MWGEDTTHCNFTMLEDVGGIFGGEFQRAQFALGASYVVLQVCLRCQPCRNALRRLLTAPRLGVSGDLGEPRLEPRLTASLLRLLLSSS